MARLLQTMWSCKAKIIEHVGQWGWRIALIPVTLYFFFSSKDPVLPASYLGKDVGVILSVMPEKDRKNLEVFFRELFEENPFGYVLLGEKPMAFDIFLQDISPWRQLWSQEDKETNQGNDYQPTLVDKFVFYCDEALSSKRLKIIKGYRTWKKYEKFFPSERFVFFYQNTPHLGSNHLTIALVNKKAFAKTVDQHVDDFREFLKREVSGESFLNELIQSQNVELIMTHHGLLGTLLGFGRDNAFLFHAESRLKTADEKKLFREQHHFEFVWAQEAVAKLLCQEKSMIFRPFASGSYAATTHPTRSTPSGSIEEEGLKEPKKGDFNGQMSFATASQENELHWIDLPCFIADTTSVETAVLRAEYLAQRAKIIDYYKGKDFLETTLRLLTSPVETL